MKKGKDRSIKTKFILYFLLIGLIPVIIASSIIYYVSSNNTLNKEEEWLGKQTADTVENMEEWIQKRLDELTLISNQIPLSMEILQLGVNKLILSKSKIQLMNQL
ncbi:hypothetical protein [Niallia sp. FSL W8-0954]|uniref:hypothetical protein n=1 Tax=Niallia sp. FSL W8-0954 TaxID=2975338 RepID=UPI0030FA7A7B